MRFDSTGLLSRLKRSWLPGGLVALSLASASIAAGQDATHPAKPLLWKVEGENLEKPSYLFGTVHLGTPAVVRLHPAARKAFDEAEVLHTEIPLNPEDQLAAAPLLMRKDGLSLSESIGEELSSRLNEELKAIHPSLDSSAFQPMKTWVIGATLPLLPYQLKGEKALDMALWSEAQTAGKKTAALETMEGQLAIFDTFAEEEQIVMLRETLSQLDEDRKAGTDPMAALLDSYLSGEEERIQTELDKTRTRLEASGDKELADRFLKRLLTDRDLAMADKIDGILRDQPALSHFFAAGALHYVGEANIRTHLSRKGYTITRIND